MRAPRKVQGSKMRSKASASKSSAKLAGASAPSSGQRRDYTKDALLPPPPADDDSFGATGMTGES